MIEPISNIPTEQLTNLFNDLDFMSLAENDQKPCFVNRYYVNRNSWIGCVLRLYEGETGIANVSIIRSICIDAVQTYGTCNCNFKELLMEKIINARLGLGRIAKTYDMCKKNNISNAIRNCIIIIDGIIPEKEKIAYGFGNENGRIRPPSTKSNDSNTTPLLNISDTTDTTDTTNVLSGASVTATETQQASSSPPPPPSIETNKIEQKDYIKHKKNNKHDKHDNNDK